MAEITTLDNLRKILSNGTRTLISDLPTAFDVGRFRSACELAVVSMPSLFECDQASFFMACRQAATDGLLPDGREGVILPYRNRKTGKTTASWQPMVWGLVKLVRQSGAVRDINAYVVRKGEAFEHWVDENGAHFRHVPDIERDDEPAIAAYAFARTTDGGVYVEAIGPKAIEQFRSMSRGDGTWSTWGDEMVKVRVLKRLCKRLPMSSDARATLMRMDARESSRTIDEDRADGRRVSPSDINRSIMDVVDVRDVRDATDAHVATPADDEGGGDDAKTGRA